MGNNIRGAISNDMDRVTGNLDPTMDALNGSLDPAMPDILNGDIDPTIPNLLGDVQPVGQRIVNDDYTPLRNKPSIESVILEGDKTFRQLGLDAATVQEVEAVLYLD